MRCPACAAETDDASQLCPRCGASAAMPQPVGEDLVAGGPDHGVETAPAIAARGGTPFGRTGELSLRVAAGIVAGAGAAVIIWACALPLVRTGGTAFSIFSISRHQVWFAADPVGVAVLGVCAGIVMVIGRHGSRLRWVAAGLLLASGAQAVLFFVSLGFGFLGGRPGNAGRSAPSAE